MVPRTILDAMGCLPSTKRTVVLPDGREEIAVTLEQFGLGMDPLHRRLIPVRAPIA